MIAKVDFRLVSGILFLTDIYARSPPPSSLAIEKIQWHKQGGKKANRNYVIFSIYIINIRHFLGMIVKIILFQLINKDQFHSQKLKRNKLLNSFKPARFHKILISFAYEFEFFPYQKNIYITIFIYLCWILQIKEGGDGRKRKGYGESSVSTKKSRAAAIHNQSERVCFFFFLFLVRIFWPKKKFYWTKTFNNFILISQIKMPRLKYWIFLGIYLYLVKLN